MQKKWMKSVLATSVLAGLCMGAVATAKITDIVPVDQKAFDIVKTRMENSVEKTGIAIMPIDQAKFLKGQRFDFEVEVLDETAESVEVTLNGKSFKDIFGGDLKRIENATKDGKKYVSFRAENVSIASVGDIELVVKAKTASGEKTRKVMWSVVGDVADKKAKNVILFVGDGMSLQAKQAARILSKGIYEGRYNNLLAMESLPDAAIVSTSGYDSIVTDSANSASAYNTGHKSVVNAMGVYENRTPDTLDDPKVETISEIIKRTRGMSVGIVTTSSVTDATPAAVTAHTRRRGDQDYIAHDFIADHHRPDVILGGGIRYFVPKAQAGSKRKDETDVIKEFEAKGYTFAGNRAEMNAASNDKPLLGLFASNHMDVYIDREHIPNKEVTKGFDDQPNLVEMTKKAIDIVSKNPNGFYLMVEGASVDKQLHTMDWQRAIYDAIELDKAVEFAKNWSKENGDDTLIVVIADHGHGISITGTYTEADGRKGREAVRTYAESKFPGFVDADGDGFPEDPNPEITLAIQYANFPDHYENYRFQTKPTPPALAAKDADGKQSIKANPARAPEGARLIEGNLPSDKETQEVHSADDIIVMAGGPGSDYFRGHIENTEIFFGIMRALGIDAVSEKAQASNDKQDMESEVKTEETKSEKKAEEKPAQ
ncbi:alkaline phosphatase ec=3.1.3.1 [Taylorella asinigenitalis 14/45]|uniref:Alkaline phosphatase n=1 Tax=Taylorella asinigenitalis 14/45 TaxID=1091495 RepID=I7JRW4_9BURK|nr:alkaline phosphatase [Taylorella asinigenitalis]CCG19867.1 alkaline phosphatase ec=3.1.3.1 [Taylorella asinigenitalis 14/45]